MTNLRRRLGVLFLLGVVLILGLACSDTTEAQPEFEGTVFNEIKPAASFQLQNQLGESINLADYRGKVVLLTFLYTNCPDVCPAATNQLISAQKQLGEDIHDDVAFVAVSVDPERDTPDSVRNHMELWSLNDNWDFLVGSRAELAPVWTAYFMDPAINNRDAGANIHVHPDGTVHLHDGSLAQGGVDALRQGILEASESEANISLEDGINTTSLIDTSDPENRYLVIHSAPAYLIDRAGNLRVVHTTPLEPKAIAHDIVLLAN